MYVIELVRDLLISICEDGVQTREERMVLRTADCREEGCRWRNQKVLENSGSFF